MSDRHPALDDGGFRSTEERDEIRLFWKQGRK